jgi:hypothetical protein
MAQDMPLRNITLEPSMSKLIDAHTIQTIEDRALV